MAKISARGATEVARVKVTHHPRSKKIEPFSVTFVMTSDGRILSKIEGSGYNVSRRVTDKRHRTRETLEAYVRGLGYEVK